MMDIGPLHREMVIEALDGVVVQAEGAIRFLDRAEDPYAEAAMRRAADFFRHAAAAMNELIAANKRRDGVSAKEAA